MVLWKKVSAKSRTPLPAENSSRLRHRKLGLTEEESSISNLHANHSVFFLDSPVTVCGGFHGRLKMKSQEELKYKDKNQTLFLCTLTMSL